MKKYYLIILIIAVSFFLRCISFKPISYNDWSVKENDSLLIDQTEVTIHAWLSYYTWKQKNEGQISANKVLPDSNAIEPLIWSYIKNKSNTFCNQISMQTGQPLGYFRLECNESVKQNKNLTSANSSTCPILSFPITGVSHQQAVEFCKWRTMIFGQGKVEYRLPSEKEWIEIAKNNFKETERKIGFRDSLIYKDKLCRMYNYRTPTPCSHMLEEGLTEAMLDVIGRFAPDDKGLYDLFGNVSEMLAENGKAKGGSYLEFASQCHPDLTQHYSKPEKWLGFRCILHRKENNGL